MPLMRYRSWRSTATSLVVGITSPLWSWREQDGCKSWKQSPILEQLLHGRWQLPPVDRTSYAKLRHTRPARAHTHTHTSLWRSDVLVAGIFHYTHSNEGKGIIQASCQRLVVLKDVWDFQDKLGTKDSSLFSSLIFQGRSQFKKRLGVHLEVPDILVPNFGAWPRMIYTGCWLGLGSKPGCLLGSGTYFYYKLTNMGQHTYFAVFSMSLKCVVETFVSYFML